MPEIEGGCAGNVSSIIQIPMLPVLVSQQSCCMQPDSALLMWNYSSASLDWSWHEISVSVSIGSGCTLKLYYRFILSRSTAKKMQLFNIWLPCIVCVEHIPPSAALRGSLCHAHQQGLHFFSSVSFSWLLQACTLFIRCPTQFSQAQVLEHWRMLLSQCIIQLRYIYMYIYNPTLAH